jgi:hypothetical protein
MTRGIKKIKGIRLKENIKNNLCDMDTITSSSSSHHLTGAASPYSLSPPQSLVLPPHPTGIHLINVLS